jgi:hypothetical protein
MEGWMDPRAGQDASRQEQFLVQIEKLHGEGY